MGTRSLTHIYSSGLDSPILVTMYRQFDGYPTGHGQDIMDFLKGKKLINGISGDTDRIKCFNGMGCLAASFIKNFKEDIGGIYIVPIGSEDHWEDYRYHVYEIDDVLYLKVVAAYSDGPITIYDGKLNDYEPSDEVDEK
jgi:hypothetical protein